MSSLSERLTRGSASSPSQVDHARRLVADWQLLADLAFADLTLWVPLSSGSWWCVAQVRPLTAPTSRPEDLVGFEVEGLDAEPFAVAHREGRPVTEGEPDWSGITPRRREVIPVRHDGVVVAVLAKDTNLAVTRSPSTLELTYLDIAADLCLMVSAGTFPPEKLQDAEMSPRVGDGLLRLDGAGRVAYASPNALSAYRRLGIANDLAGADLVEVTRTATVDRVAAEAVAAGIAAAVAGRFPDPMDVEGASATMLVRALPLRPPGAEAGAPGVVRGGTHVRRRGRGRAAKDAPAPRRRGGGAGAGPRRHRRPPAGPGAADQGRDHPRDPPPGEEQPADRRRAAPAAGAADDRARCPGGPGGVGPPGRLDRRRARDAGRQPGGRRRRRRRPRPGAAHARRPHVDRAGCAHQASRLLRGTAGRRGDTARPRGHRAVAQRRRARVPRRGAGQHRAGRRAGRERSRGARAGQRPGPAGGIRPGGRRRARAADRAHPRHERARRQPADGDPRRPVGDRGRADPAGGGAAAPVGRPRQRPRPVRAYPGRPRGGRCDHACAMAVVQWRPGARPRDAGQLRLRRCGPGCEPDAA